MRAGTHTQVDDQNGQGWNFKLLVIAIFDWACTYTIHLCSGMFDAAREVLRPAHARLKQVLQLALGRGMRNTSGNDELVPVAPCGQEKRSLENDPSFIRVLNVTQIGGGF